MPVPAEAQSLAHSTPTPSQTAGPFVSIGTEWAATGLMVPEGTPGAISVTGRVPMVPVPPSRTPCSSFGKRGLTAVSR